MEIYIAFLGVFQSLKELNEVIIFIESTLQYDCLSDFSGYSAQSTESTSFGTANALGTVAFVIIRGTENIHKF